MIEWLLNNGFGMMWKKVAVPNIKVLSKHLPTGAQEHSECTQSE